MENCNSSDDEEVYFGSVKKAEIPKLRRFLGDNYNSPLTPRLSRSSQSSHGPLRSLPDVLGNTNTSTPVQSQGTGGSGHQSTPLPSGDALLDESDDVIILDASRNSHSIITLSDDESFLQNEEKYSEIGERVEGTNKNMMKEGLSPSEMFNLKENSQQNTFSDNFNSFLTENNSLHESSTDNIENRDVLQHNNSLNDLETVICDLESSASSLVQDIDDFVGNSEYLGNSSAATVDQIVINHSLLMPQDTTSPNHSNQSLSADKEAAIGNCVGRPVKHLSSSELLVPKGNANVTELLVPNNTAVKSGNSFDLSGLSTFEFSLNGVSDSILNISHGSSLPSPPPAQQAANPVFHKPVYEDISCDGEQLESVADCSDVQRISENPDLHMSVDEAEYDTSITGNSQNTSQPSGCKSFPSAQTSYSTAYDASDDNYSTTEQSNSFQKYRDVSSNSDFDDGIATVSIIPGEENKNEGNFEMVMQNRQNSFNGTPASKIVEKNINGNKPRVMSKLPVFHNSKSFLKPPQLNVKQDTLKISSFKFAKQISKTGVEKVSKGLPKPESKKLVLPSTGNRCVNSPSVKENKTSSEKCNVSKTPSRIGTPKLNMCTTIKTPYMTQSRIPSHSVSSLKTKSQTNATKTPATTPGQNISNIPRAVKSDSKVKRVLTPLNNYSPSETNVGKNPSMKNKYRNIVSPIQAYIRGSPPVSQRKAQVIVEEKERSPLQTQVDIPMKSVPKAMQQLKYDNAKGQENRNPNVIDFSRDTIPCKVLEPSLEVFWKEREQPQPCLPKMGEKLTKLLAAPPKVKITCHEGRVNHSPNSKGVLVPNNEIPTSSESDVHNTDNTELLQKSDGRISIRIQKTVDLP